MIEDQNTIKKPDMEVILKTYINGVGKKGEIVKVRPNFAYKGLLLPGLAAYVTPENIEKYKLKEGEQGEEEKHSSQYAQRVSRNKMFKKLYSLFS